MRNATSPPLLIAAVFSLAAAITAVDAQPPGAQPYPERETNAEAVARGRVFYETYGCAFCHGADIHGGAGGPSLLRSLLVQNDVAGELIGDVIRDGRPGTTMAAFPLKQEEIADVAEYLHSFRLSSRERGRIQPESIVTGNARTGRRFFSANCAQCHAADGDLANIARRFRDPRALQQQWLMPRDAPPITASVATVAGTTTGRIVRIDEFLITLATDDGRQRTFKREGDVPRVTIDDPLAAHRALLPKYKDSDIHDVTAYLVTLE